jgi:hypothetical protein
MALSWPGDSIPALLAELASHLAVPTLNSHDSVHQSAHVYPGRTFRQTPEGHGLYPRRVLRRSGTAEGEAEREILRCLSTSLARSTTRSVPTSPSSVTQDSPLTPRRSSAAPARSASPDAPLTSTGTSRPGAARILDLYEVGALREWRSSLLS